MRTFFKRKSETFNYIWLSLNLNENIKKHLKNKLLSLKNFKLEILCFLAKKLNKNVRIL